MLGVTKSGNGRFWITYFQESATTAIFDDDDSVGWIEVDKQGPQSLLGCISGQVPNMDVSHCGLPHLAPGIIAPTVLNRSRNELLQGAKAARRNRSGEKTIRNLQSQK